MAHRYRAKFLRLTSVLIDLQFVRYEIGTWLVILMEEGIWSHESEAQNFSGYWSSDEQVRTSVQVRADVWNQVTTDI